MTTVAASPILQWIEGLGFETLFLLLLAPIFLICIALEFWHFARRGRADVYNWREVGNNAVLALSHQVVDAAAWAGLLVLFRWVWQHRLLEIPLTAGAVFALWLLQDFFYYWFHRASHRIRWMWASHVVHHSSERLNLSTAFRQSLTYPISGMWLFWLPLAWIGFQPEHIVLCVGANLAFQFFVHTQAIGKLGWAEKIFNTPSVHRVHHARNPQYIDKNYAGVLVIWDRLFGSYVEEQEPCEYGIVRQVRTNNPFVMMFHEWIAMFRDAARPGPLGQRLKHLWAPPEFARPAAAELPPAGATVRG